MMRSKKMKPLYAVIAAGLLALLVMPIAFAGAAKGPEASTSAASVRVQLQKLKTRIAFLESNGGTPRTPTGAAGGDLTGNYPNPTIGPNAVGSTEVTNDSLAALDIGTAAIASDEITDETVRHQELAGESVGADELKGTYAAVSNGITPGANTYADRTATCNAGDIVLGGGHSWQNNAASFSTAFSTPDGLSNPNQWVVRSKSSDANNTLFAWATCLSL